MDNTRIHQLTGQLRALLALTNTEAQIAATRQGQARTDAVRRELAQNADNAVSRAAAIERTLQELGGVPDVVSPVLGRFGALVKTVAEQPEPLAGALLEDLALEHQLADRARYLKASATAADAPRVVTLAQRLITAHDATVQWLTTVLAEDALGGPTALRATPLQTLARTTALVVGGPARLSAAGINRAVAAVRGTRGRLVEVADEVADRGARVSDEVRQTLTASRDAGLAKAEELARQDGDRDRATTVHRMRAQTGALKAAELPIPDYPGKSVAEAVAAVRDLREPADLQAVLGYEEAHKNRSSVISATQTHLASIAKETVGVG